MVDFASFNGTLSKLSSEFQTPEFIGAADKIKTELQTASESAFKSLDSAVKGGIEMVGPIAADAVDKIKILEPQIAKLDKTIADKLPVMKEAIASVDLTNIGAAVEAATTGATAIDIHDIFPDVESTVENIAEMNFDVLSTADLEGVTTALQATITSLPVEDLKDVLNDINPGEILGEGILDPVKLMEDVNLKVPTAGFTQALGNVQGKLTEALGGLSGGDGLILAALEAKQNVLSANVFGSIPNFPQNKIGELVGAFGKGDAVLSRNLAVSELQLSDELKEVLEASNIKAKFGGLDDLQDTLSLTANLSLKGKLGAEFDQLQQTVNNVQVLFPDILPTAGSFLNPSTNLPDVTFDTVTFKGGTPSKASVPTKTPSTTVAKTTAAGTTFETTNASGQVTKTSVPSTTTKTINTSGPPGTGVTGGSVSSTGGPPGTGSKVAGTVEPDKVVFEDGSTSTSYDPNTDPFFETTDDFEGSEPVILRSFREISQYLKSSEREFSTLLVDWTGTYIDQSLTAHDIDKMYKSNGHPGIPYHFIIKKDGMVELGKFLEDEGTYKIGYNKLSIGVAFVAGYATAVPNVGDVGTGGLTATSISKSQMRGFKRLLRGFFSTLPLGQVYGMNDLVGDKTSSTRSAPGFSVTDFIQSPPFNKGNLGDPVSNGGFYTNDELVKLITSSFEGED